MRIPSKNQNVDISTIEQIPAKVEKVLSEIFPDLETARRKPMQVIDSMPEHDKEAATAWLEMFYRVGCLNAANVGPLVLQGLKKRIFGYDSYRAFPLLALLLGAQMTEEFSLLGVFRSISTEEEQAKLAWWNGLKETEKSMWFRSLKPSTHQALVDQAWGEYKKRNERQF